MDTIQLESFSNEAPHNQRDVLIPGSSDRLFEDIDLIISSSKVMIYAAGCKHYPYPYRLEPVNDLRPSVRETCDTFIVDSGFTDDSVTNRDVLDAAIKIDADYVIPKDYVGDQERTTDSVLSFFDLYDEYDVGDDLTVVVPLQPPHDTHYDELSGYSHYALGGVAKKPPHVQLDYVKTFRGQVGYAPYVHGLGMGASMVFVEAIHENPQLLNSIDISSFERSVAGNKLRDTYMKEIQYSLPTGTHSNAIRAMFAWSQFIVLNYLYSDFSTVLEDRDVQTTVDMW